MTDQIGKIETVRLREVWHHEALGLTSWLENNIDVNNEVLDLELCNAEREKPVCSLINSGLASFSP